MCRPKHIGHPRYTTVQCVDVGVVDVRDLPEVGRGAVHRDHHVGEQVQLGRRNRSCVVHSQLGIFQLGDVGDQDARASLRMQNQSVTAQAGPASCHAAQVHDRAGIPRIDLHGTRGGSDSVQIHRAAVVRLNVADPGRTEGEIGDRGQIQQTARSIGAPCDILGVIDDILEIRQVYRAAAGRIKVTVDRHGGATGYHAGTPANDRECRIV